MQETAPFNYLYLNYAWVINQLNYPFKLGLLISHGLHFQVFNVADNLKASRATHSFLGLNKSFTKLKIGDKSLFDMFLWKYFATNFTFNGSEKKVKKKNEKKCMITSSLYK